MLKAWRPVASSVRSRLRDWLLGGAHLLTDPSHMAPLQHAQVRGEKGRGGREGKEEGGRSCVVQGCCLTLCLMLYCLCMLMCGLCCLMLYVCVMCVRVWTSVVVVVG